MPWTNKIISAMLELVRSVQDQDGRKKRELSICKQNHRHQNSPRTASVTNIAVAMRTGNLLLRITNWDLWHLFRIASSQLYNCRVHIRSFTFDLSQILKLGIQPTERFLPCKNKQEFKADADHQNRFKNKTCNHLIQLNQLRNIW